MSLFHKEPISPNYGQTTQVFIQEAEESGDTKTAEALRKIQELRASLIAKRNAERD